MANWPTFESYAKEVMEREQIAGLAAGVSCRGQVVYANGLGVRDTESGAPVTPETVFGIASVSKSFAALAVMQLIDDGAVDPQAPVAEYLPEFMLRAAPNTRAIRVHHCLSHTTGLPPLTRRQGEFTDFGQHLAYLAGYETALLGYPGQYMSYCNDAFLLSGAIVERVTGRRFADFVRERTIAPLGMDRTTYDLEQVYQWSDVTTLYNLDSAKATLLPQPWPELGTYHVGGGVRSTVLDLLKYGDMYCAKGLAAGGRVVSEAGVLRMRQPVYPTGEGTHYCYGLQITPAYHGVTLVEHGGSLPGVSARWGYIPELDVSVAVLANVRGVPADVIWSGLVNTALGLPPATQRSKPAPTYPLVEAQLAVLTGTYSTDEGARVEIKLDGPDLVVEMDGQSYGLRPTSPETAMYESQGLERLLRWYLDDAGRAWALKVGARMVWRRDADGA